MVGLLLFAGFLTRLDLGELGRALAGVDPGRVALSVVLGLPELALRSRLLEGLVEAAGGRLRGGEAFRATVIGQGLGFATPAKAGDFAKAAYLSCGLSPGRLAGVLLADRLCLAAGLGVWALAGLGLRTGMLPGAALAAAAGLAGLGVLLAGLLRLRRRRAGKPQAAPLAPAPPGPRRALVAGVALAVLVWGVHLLRGGLLARALDLPVPLLAFALLAAVAAAAECLPVSVLGLGVREGSLVWLLVPYGVRLPEVMALSVLGLAAGGLWALAGLAWAARAVRPRTPPEAAGEGELLSGSALLGALRSPFPPEVARA